MKETGLFLSLLTVGVVVTACTDHETSAFLPASIDLPTSRGAVTKAQWQALGSRRFFFGHQSVGRNIIAGMRHVLTAHPEIPLRIVNAQNPANVDSPAFIEAQIGLNTKPETKAKAFAEALETGFGSEPGVVAMYKYCYVDMQPDMNPDTLFADYVRNIERLRALYPALILVHITMPLRRTDGGLKTVLMTRAGLNTQLALNMKRNRFNELLRQRYGATGTLFDLALLESTRSDGREAYTRYRGRDVTMLAPEWTDDGGHLNERGQVYIGGEFLAFLARVSTAAAAAAKAPDDGARE